eukprot:276122-Amphidinium_carterae.1
MRPCRLYGLLRAWFARVPSSCNIADAPSRGANSELELRWGAVRVATPDFTDRLVAIKEALHVRLYTSEVRHHSA